MSLRVCSVSNSSASILAPEPLGCLLDPPAPTFVPWEALLTFWLGFLLASGLFFGGFGSLSIGDGFGVGTLGGNVDGESSTKSYSSFGSIFLSLSFFSDFSTLYDGRDFSAGTSGTIHFGDLSGAGESRSRSISLEQSRFFFILAASFPFKPFSFSSFTFGCLVGDVEALELVL